jgi:hypothetical protein
MKRKSSRVKLGNYSIRTSKSFYPWYVKLSNKLFLEANAHNEDYFIEHIVNHEQHFSKQLKELKDTNMDSIEYDKKRRMLRGLFLKRRYQLMTQFIIARTKERRDKTQPIKKVGRPKSIKTNI